MPDITEDRVYKRVIVFELSEAEWIEFSNRTQAEITPMERKIWNNMYRLNQTTIDRLEIGEIL